MNEIQTETFRKAIGAAVRKARRAADLSQGELGRRFKTPRTYNMVSDLEHGRYPVQIETLIQVAEITNTPAMQLIGPGFDALARLGRDDEDGGEDDEEDDEGELEIDDVGMTEEECDMY